MTEARRRLLHRRVAEALERVHAASARRGRGPDRRPLRERRHGRPSGRRTTSAPRRSPSAWGPTRRRSRLLHRGLDAAGHRCRRAVDRDARELGLQTALGVSLVATEGYGAAGVARRSTRAAASCARSSVDRRARRSCVRWPSRPSAQAKIDECHALGRSPAEPGGARRRSRCSGVEAHYVIAMSLLLTGAVRPGADAARGVARPLRPRPIGDPHRRSTRRIPAVVCLIRLSLDLWILGDPTGSARRRAESLSLAERARAPIHPGYALTWDAILQCLPGRRWPRRHPGGGGDRPWPRPQDAVLAVDRDDHPRMGRRGAGRRRGRDRRDAQGDGGLHGDRQPVHASRSSSACWPSSTAGSGTSSAA